jgi:hypothetical protein
MGREIFKWINLNRAVPWNLKSLPFISKFSNANWILATLSAVFWTFSRLFRANFHLKLEANCDLIQIIRIILIVQNIFFTYFDILWLLQWKERNESILCLSSLWKYMALVLQKCLMFMCARLDIFQSHSTQLFIACVAYHKPLCFDSVDELSLLLPRIVP